MAQIYRKVALFLGKHPRNLETQTVSVNQTWAKRRSLQSLNLKHFIICFLPGPNKTQGQFYHHQAFYEQNHTFKSCFLTTKHRSFNL